MVSLFGLFEAAHLQASYDMDAGGMPAGGLSDKRFIGAITQLAAPNQDQITCHYRALNWRAC
jgi:hypothetical protein